MNILLFLPFDAFPKSVMSVPDDLTRRHPPVGIASVFPNTPAVPISQDFEQELGRKSTAETRHPETLSASMISELVGPVLEWGMGGVSRDQLRSSQNWNLQQDFRTDPQQANPNPDSYGNTDVWYFLRSETYDPADYTLLPEFINDAFSVPNLEQWQGPFGSDGPKNKLPEVGINATGSLQHISTFDWPNGWVRVHPWSTELVIVGWRSPIQGSVNLFASFMMMDSTGGNGIDWSINQGNSVLGTGDIPMGGKQRVRFHGVSVNEGDFLYFIVDSKNGKHFYDSTHLVINISSTGA